MDFKQFLNETASHSDKIELQNILRNMAKEFDKLSVFWAQDDGERYEELLGIKNTNKLEKLFRMSFEDFEAELLNIAKKIK